MKKFHIAIVGGGVIGSAIARELSKYQLDTIVFEKGSDVASSTSKANSGVIHSGINSPPKSLKARLCVEGNELFKPLADDLSVPIKRIGKYIIAKNEEEIKQLIKLKEIGKKNKIKGLKLLESDKVLLNEPKIRCKNALWVPSAGIISPYELTIALAENSIINGVKFLVNAEVKNIKNKNEKFYLETNRGSFKSDILINAAGLNCRNIVEMLEEPDFDIYPNRGEYLVLDKNCKNLIKSLIYPIPQERFGFLGIHLTPTLDGNILLGPTSEYIHDIYDNRTTKEKIKLLFKEAKEILPDIKKEYVINAYAGIRCKIVPPGVIGFNDFRIENSKKIQNFINLLGIESPGLTAAPAISKEISKIISKNIKLKEKKNFISKYNKYIRFSDLTNDNKISKIKNDSNWGRVICRCENVTEAEIINAITNPLDAKSLTSIKYRCRAGMGRCQSGFCTQHIVRILKERYNIKETDIILKSKNSNLFIGKTREETL